MQNLEIWFWQRIVSPHIAGLAVALAQLGCRVIFVVEKTMSDERTAQGWHAPKLFGVDLRYAPTKREILFQVAEASPNSVHICQGVRANGLVSMAQVEISRRGGLFWVGMETVEDSGLSGVMKRMLYRWIFWRCRLSISGVLAIGRVTPNWVHARGIAKNKIFPFAYFLEDAKVFLPSEKNNSDKQLKFLFVGQLIERKRLELLINALENIAKDFSNFRLQIVGSGPLEADLRSKEFAISKKMDWMGQCSMEDVRKLMSRADCLVLPSRHDGWGAVVSEALMAGTPVICSNRCGASEVVLASGTGGVFDAENSEELEQLLAHRMAQGRQTVSARGALAVWARSVGALAGARYLMQIIEFQMNAGERPFPPWRSAV